MANRVADISQNNTIDLTVSSEKKEPIKKVTTPKSKRGPSFVCIMCENKFKSHSALIIHFREHGTNIDIRGRPMSQSTLLKHPKKDNSGPQPIKCEFCLTVLPDISRALQHKFRKHRNEGNSFCEFCGKLFPLKILLQQHKEKTHSNELTENNVDASGSAGATKVDPKKNEEPRKCPMCSATFLTANALSFHFHGAHKVSYDFLMPEFVPPPSTKIKLNNASEAHSVYYCHICGSEYILKHNLKKHIRDDHTQVECNNIPEQIIRCKTCEALFYTPKAYTAHLTYHRPGDWHVPSEEHRGRILARVDQDFDIRRVPSVRREEQLVRAALQREKSRRNQKISQASTSKLHEKKNASDEESMSPPSSPSSSEDEQENSTSTDNINEKESETPVGKNSSKRSADCSTDPTKDNKVIKISKLAEDPPAL